MFWHLLEKFVKLLKPIRKKGKIKSIWREIFHFANILVRKLVKNLNSKNVLTFTWKIRQIAQTYRWKGQKQLNLTGKVGFNENINLFSQKRLQNTQHMCSLCVLGSPHQISVTVLIRPIRALCYCFLAKIWQADQSKQSG